MDKRVHFSTASVANNTRMRSSGHVPPAVVGKKVFFEGYSDSPEYSRVNNPVVHMRDSPETEDEDDGDYVDPSSKFANYQSPMDRQKWVPMDLRRLAVFGAQKQANTNAAIRNDEKTRAAESTPSIDQSVLAGDEENLTDEDDDEREDDTFEFLLK